MNELTGAFVFAAGLYCGWIFGLCTARDFPAFAKRITGATKRTLSK